jgi:putative inorganic carbon (hco3(-)) transporter
MKIKHRKRSADLPKEKGTRNAAFYLFCAFIVSYFIHLTARISVLGAMHFDLLLAAGTAFAIVFAQRAHRPGAAVKIDPVSRQLWVLLAYILVTIPFVEWPGSVLHNLEQYAKCLCFFFFVVATVDTTRKLAVLLAVWTATQLWRVLEPLYLHLTQDYWGSFTSLGNWEYMDRLSGAPYDTINPNGLGFVIILTLPLLHFLIKPDTVLRRMLWVGVVCAMCYVLVLSASRSGFLALVFLALFVIWRSKQRAALLTVAVVGAVIGLGLMSNLQRERYVSIYSNDAPGAATAQGRITGVIDDFKVSLRRPLFGHGLGTSREVNGNFRGVDLPSHNLYTEAAEELGYIGLGMLLALLWSFLRACWTAQRIVSAAPSDDPRLSFLHKVAAALIVVVAVDLFFSFASYGVSEPYWYFLGGLSVATSQLAIRLAPAAAAAVTNPRPARGSRWKLRGRARPTRGSGRRPALVRRP